MKCVQSTRCAMLRPVRISSAGAEMGSQSLAGIAEAKNMLGFPLSLTVSPTATTPVAEGYKVLIARPVPAGGFVQLASN